MVTTSEHKLTLDPNDAKAHFAKGQSLDRLERYSEALPHF